MAQYDINCSDGSNDCHGTLSTDIPYVGLNKEQLAQVTAAGGRVQIELNPRQVERNASILTEDQKEAREKDGSLWVEIRAETVCGGCGSDG